MSIAKRALVEIYREKLLDIYSTAINSIKPSKLLSNFVTVHDDTLSIKNKQSGHHYSEINLKTNNVHIISFGKSALSLTSSLGKLIIQSGSLRSFKDGYVLAPTHLEDKLITDINSLELFRSLNLRCRFGAKNNLPDNQSVAATKELLELIDHIVEEDEGKGLKSTFLILLGGGGSACLTYPRHIDLELKLNLIKFLQQRGADIVELNKVRRYFSYVKGGQLASYIIKQRENVGIISLIVSDVIGNPLEFIASGPTFLDCDQANDELLRDEMVAVLGKYGYRGMDRIYRCINDATQSHKVVDTSKVQNIIVGDNSTAIQAAKLRAEELGFEVFVLSDSLAGHTESIVATINGYQQKILSKCDSNVKPFLIIAGGEATIGAKPDDTWGLGGRCQEIALDYLIAKWDDQDEVIGSKPSVDLFLAGTTDGQDGPTDVAACLVSHRDLFDSNCEGQDLSKLKLSALDAKKCHNSNQFWLNNKPSTLIRTGLTETNVMDLYMLMTGY